MGERKCKWVKRVILVMLGTSLMLGLVRPLRVQAEPEEYDRTVMLYICGANLESVFGEATHNLMQILNANFSAEDRIKFVVMTGGTGEWQISSDYLSIDPTLVPEGQPTDAISVWYNQIWEARGADASEHASEMILLDGDGVLGDGAEAHLSVDELMSDPEVLKAFIDYSAEHFPAEKYDLILWDHGGGPCDGFAVDEHDSDVEMMSFAELLDAFSDNAVTRDGGRFDFVDFDACLMGNVELSLAFAPYMDYYIASPETEPGNGQDYSGWLNALGVSSEIDTYEIGKIIVDDMIAYYEDEARDGEEATLSVIDMQKLRESGLREALDGLITVMNEEMRAGQDNSAEFYDELRSAKGSIRYAAQSDVSYYDLGNFVGQLGVPVKEVKLTDGYYNKENSYSPWTKQIMGILEDPELLYCAGTKGITAPSQIVMDKNGELRFDELQTSGLSIFFPPEKETYSAAYYNTAIREALPYVNDPETAALLKKMADTAVDCALIRETVNAVLSLLDDGFEKDMVDYSLVMDQWDEEGTWGAYLKDMVESRYGSADQAEPWLEALVSQDIRDAVSADSVSATKIIGADGDGYEVQIDDADKRVIEGVELHLQATLPYAVDYLMNETNYGYFYNWYPDAFMLTLGAEEGYEDQSDLVIDPEGTLEEALQAYIDWYQSTTSHWSVPAANMKCYALRDAEGELHAASVSFDNAGRATVLVQGILTEEKKQFVYLTFTPDTLDYRLAEIMIPLGTGARPASPADLQGELTEVNPVLMATVMNGMVRLELPMSSSTFTLNKENADQIRLVYVNADQVSDLGEELKTKLVVRDMYDHQTDISEAARNPVETLYNIDLAEVEPVIYNGFEQGPKLTFEGETLQENVDYLWIDQEEEDCIQPGEYQVLLIGKGRFAGKILVTHTIIYKGEWKKVGTEWMFLQENGLYARNSWKLINGIWYSFDQQGYMEHDAYRKGYYLKPNGAWNGAEPVPGWEQDDTGWRYAVTGDTYLCSTWKKIDGKWYYFKADGYAAQNEFVNGWWLGGSCVQNDPVHYGWHKSSRGWWYGAAGGWYARNATYVINGKKYTFDRYGYCVNP